MPFRRTRMFRDPFVEFVALLLLALAGDDDNGAVEFDLVTSNFNGSLIGLFGHTGECGFAQLARGLDGRAQAIWRRWERRRFLPPQGRFIAIDLAVDRL